MYSSYVVLLYENGCIVSHPSSIHKLLLQFPDTHLISCLLEGIAWVFVVLIPTFPTSPAQRKGFWNAYTVKKKRFTRLVLQKQYHSSILIGTDTRLCRAHPGFQFVSLSFVALRNDEIKLFQTVKSTDLKYLTIEVMV